ncbi:MAG: glucose-1-phosphate adenylyltransferase subunit GlgD [Oscillibacter sp.]|nr:glucose-1-phosphate adenylyltransferase subunit GlgD [Oscillibacter sp.]
MNGLHGIIFCYEKRNDLRELADTRSAASMPFGGRYRAIDFGLSNLVNAGVTDVGIVLHGRYQSLIDHLGSGKNWDLSRKRGGLKLLPPFAYERQRGGTGEFRGKMEALSGVRSYLDTIRQDHVALMDGDLVVNLPLSEILEQHLRSGADITAVCGNDSFAVDNGTYFEPDGEGRVGEVLYHLHTPRGYRGLEVYIISTRLLKELVDECISRDQYSWRHDILQARVGELNIRSFIWTGFAAQIRSVQEYYDRSMQLLDPAIRADLFTPERPIRAKNADKSSSYAGPTGHCVNSLVGDGCNVEGVVENSILFPGVVVEEGARVRNCVLFPDTVIRRNADLAHIIADKQVEVLADRTLIGHSSYPLVLSKGACV